MCVIGTLVRGPLSVVAGTRTPVSSTLDRASAGSFLCGSHGRTHELNVLVNRAIGFLVTYSHSMVLYCMATVWYYCMVLYGYSTSAAVLGTVWYLGIRSKCLQRIVLHTTVPVYAE